MATILINDDRALHQIEDALHVELIPGTEVMTDVGAIHFKHSSAHGHRVLVPQPSSDPNDPLNWSRTWKGLTMAGMAISSFANGFGPLSEAPQVPAYMAEWNISLPDTINTISICILVLGFSNLIRVPFAGAFGRRPMILVSTIIGIGSCIWRATAPSYNSFIGACVLSGIGAGPGEALGPMLVGDVMFLHKRELYMGLYMWSYWIGVMLGPVIAGIMTESYGWRSFWWCNIAVCTFALVYQIFLLPETKWNRKASSPLSQDTAQAPTPPTTTTSSSEKVNLQMVENRTGLNIPDEEIVVQLSGSPDALWLPFRLFAFPIVQWSSFVFSWAASCCLVANITQSQALAGPPWNLNAASVGYTNIAIFVGASIPLLTAGPLTGNKTSGLIPFACATLVGSVVVAISYQHGWSWEVIVIFGYTLLGLQVASIAAIATTHSMDSYKPVTGEFIVSATIKKNLWGYGVSKLLNVWIIEVGYITPIMTNMGLCLFFIALGVPLYFYGKNIRRWSKNSSVHPR